ncbi:unnamed protein product [Diatraea saccharalis]|uniref:Chitin-binding type-2 domain-containing protein n=1 Tax=Diatraea saccharalis TaxID=40085 RepID=A0A9N9WHL8_9NEOP|nr:unnamed protein product [Diatraea saccharalis]
MANRIWVAVGIILSLSSQVQSAVDCNTTGVGRFADPTDTTCKKYTLCVYNSSTKIYTSYNYTCPTTLFNPNTGTCSPDYVCEVTNPASSLCTEDGYIPNPNSNCTGFIECVKINNTFTATNYSCPDDTFFNPNTTLCETSYKCPTPTFTCTAAGRFANEADSTCQTYYMCVLVSSNGTYVQEKYNCPSTSVFSPSSSFCTTSYACP